jgi:hypothetical protein
MMQQMEMETPIEQSELGRRRSFPVLLPKRLKSDSDSALRFQLISLKNAEAALVVHIRRIETELKRRGTHTQILGHPRE